MRRVGRVTASAAIALVLIAAQGSQLLHLLLAPHEICPQHGDLVERSGPANGAETPPRAATLARAGLLSQSLDAVHSHDRCLTTLGDSDGVIAGAALPAVRTGQPGSIGLLPPALVGGRGPPLYRLAPKTSPPA
jgi:hypothetical protein